MKPVEYSAPSEPWAWPLIFFIAESVTRDENGYIVAVVNGTIPLSLRHTLVEIIMQWKPMHTWCALMCNYN